MKQKICTMNCGPALSDTRSQAERMAKCEDCPLGTEIKALQYLGFANIVTATWSPEEIEY